MLFPEPHKEEEEFKKFCVKYFAPQIETVNDVDYVPSKRLKKLLKRKYEIKVPVRKYMDKCLNCILQFIDFT